MTSRSRDDLVKILRDHHESDEHGLLDLQLLVLAIATNDTFADDNLLAYASSITDLPLFVFAGSGRFALAASSVPLYLALLQSFEDAPRDFWEQALMSVSDLTGVDDEQFDDEPTMDEIGGAVAAVLNEASAPYLFEGRAFHPAATAKTLTAFAMKAEKTGRTLTTVPESDQLAMWSGIPAPHYVDAPATEAVVREVVEYALTLSQLPWRDGVKYFYGHDVDGGPGLHENVPV